MNNFLLGAVVMACAVIGLFFLRFWHKTRDRFFAILTGAFWMLGLNWAALAYYPTEEKVRTWLYFMRLIAFVLIIMGILDKNRQRPESGTGMTQ
jgi:hypothetical protein